MRLSPDDLKASLRGLLAFSLTPFTPGGEADLGALRDHVEMLLACKCAAIFAAGGTGEFFSLAPGEYRQVVAACTDQVRGRVPVVAGVGHGVGLAREYVRAAEEAGADGVLVLPPYLISGPQDGLAQHYLAVASATRLGVMVYQRGGTRFEPDTVCAITQAPNVIGFKDGVGDVDAMQQITRAVGERLAYLNGMPTAEVYARSLLACGITAYSSALLTFLPEISTAFAAAFMAGDNATMDHLLDRAILPFAEIRRRVPGYAVSLVKAGARLRGLPVGSVRPPLADPRPGDMEDLQSLLTTLKLDGELAAA